MPFSHDDETAQAGYYELTTGSGADAVTTELTTAMRAGVARFTFPASQQANLLFKLTGTASQVDGTSAQVVGDGHGSRPVSSRRRRPSRFSYRNVARRPRHDGGRGGPTRASIA